MSSIQGEAAVMGALSIGQNHERSVGDPDVLTLVPVDQPADLP
jgi:hypothetical protein